MTDSMIIGLSFGGYLAAMFAIGWAAYRNTTSVEDYLIGGRRMNFFVTALSAGASDMSGWLIMGLPGAIFAAGLYDAWIGVALLLGIILNWSFVAKPLRIASERLGAITISEYLEKRFSDQSGRLRLLTAIVILVFFFIYTISGLVAGGKLFEAVFGVNYQLAVVISGAAIVLYTAVGGFIAVSWTDMIQGLLMLLALILVPLFALRSLPNGGLTNAIGESALSWTQHRVSGESLTAFTLISTFGWGLGYFGMPHILTRFMAIDSPDHLPKARATAIGWSAFTLTGAILTGLCAIAVFSQAGTELDTEQVFILLIQEFFHPVPASICLAAILAAIMSTADSQLLVCTSVITEDLYRTFYKRDASEAELIRVGRIAVVLIAGIAILFALDRNSKVMDLVSYAWAGFGAAFGPVILFSLYKSTMSARAAVAGILSGGASVVIWKHLSGGVFELYELMPAFFISCAVILLVDGVSRKGAKTQRV